MKSAPFEYERVATVADAVQALSRGNDAWPLAGGQSLIPLLAMREARPGVLVDLRHVNELDYIEVRGDHLAIGAMSRHYTVETSPVVAECAPLLSAAITRVAYPTVRNQGTAGGSLAFADHRAEYPAVAMTLDGSIVLTSAAGERVIPAADFFTGHCQTVRRPDELVTELRIPLTQGWVWAMDELTLRYRDFAVVAAYAGVKVGDDGRITAARVTVGATDPVPIRVVAAESALVGAEPSAEVVAVAAEAAAAAVSPSSDRFGPPAYRKAVTKTYVERVLSTVLSL
jgi:carbon-monoxide dehydrogenase medium subunit